MLAHVFSCGSVYMPVKSNSLSLEAEYTAQSIFHYIFNKGSLKWISPMPITSQSQLTHVLYYNSIYTLKVLNKSKLMWIILWKVFLELPHFTLQFLDFFTLRYEPATFATWQPYYFFFNNDVSLLSLSKHPSLSTIVAWRQIMIENNWDDQQKKSFIFQEPCIYFKVIHTI